MAAPGGIKRREEQAKAQGARRGRGEGTLERPRSGRLLRFHNRTTSKLLSLMCTQLNKLTIFNSVFYYLYMIDWFYSDPWGTGFWTGVTRGDQKLSGNPWIEQAITFLIIGARELQDILGLSTRRDLFISGVYFLRKGTLPTLQQTNSYT